MGHNRRARCACGRVYSWAHKSKRPDPTCCAERRGGAEAKRIGELRAQKVEDRAALKAVDPYPEPGRPLTCGEAFLVWREVLKS